MPCNTTKQNLDWCNNAPNCYCYKMLTIRLLMSNELETRKKHHHHEQEEVFPYEELPLRPCIIGSEGLAWCSHHDCFCWPDEEHNWPPVYDTPDNPPAKRSIPNPAQIKCPHAARAICFHGICFCRYLLDFPSRPHHDAKPTSTSNSTLAITSSTSRSALAITSSTSHSALAITSTTKSSTTSTPTAIAIVTPDEICTDGTPVFCDGGQCYCRPFSEFEPNLPRPANSSLVTTATR